MHNLTRNHAPIDSIDGRIKGFSFRDYEEKIRQLIGDFSLFFQQNLDFKDSDVKMSLEVEEIKGFKDCVVYFKDSSIYSNHLRHAFFVEEHVYKYVNLGVTVGFDI